MRRRSSHDHRKARRTDFTQLEPIGEGSFGRTYIATDKRTGQQVVLKIISAENVERGGAEEEIDILEYLRPWCAEHLLCYIDSFTDPQTEDLYIVTQYLREFIPFDQWLKQLRRRTQRLSPSGAWALICNLVRGVEDIHDAGVAHRDIKPANLLIDPATYRVKIIDFGAACWTQCSYGLAGTPAYMPPELWPEQRVRFLTAETANKMDLWSLGLVIWEALTAGTPFWNSVMLTEVSESEDPEALRLLEHPEAIAAYLDALKRDVARSSDPREVASLFRHAWLLSSTVPRADTQRIWTQVLDPLLSANPEERSLPTELQC